MISIINRVADNIAIKWLDGQLEVKVVTCLVLSTLIVVQSSPTTGLQSVVSTSEKMNVDRDSNGWEVQTCYFFGSLQSIFNLEQWALIAQTNRR